MNTIKSIVSKIVESTKNLFEKILNSKKTETIIVAAANGIEKVKVATSDWNLSLIYEIVKYAFGFAAQIGAYSLVMALRRHVRTGNILSSITVYLGFFGLAQIASKTATSGVNDWFEDIESAFSEFNKSFTQAQS